MAVDSVSPMLPSVAAVSAVTATRKAQVGERVRIAGNDYLYVYNAGDAQISKGEMGFILSLSSGYSVTVSNAASQTGIDTVVGVAHNATIPTGEYGWLCTKGVVLVALDGDEVSMDAGTVLAPGVDGGFVALGAATTQTTGLRVGLGHALNSLVTTVGTGKARFCSPIFG